MFFRRQLQRPLHDGGFLMFDTVLDQVSLTVGSHPVETGGALLGDYTSGVITRFLFDEDAETTAVSYIPSRRLNDRVNIAEAEGRLQFKGVLHSHPGNFDSPSGPDANSFLEGLKENPELSRYLAPIVTFKEGDARDNKMALPGGGWISFYVAMREGRNDVRIERTMPDIIHFGRDCRVITNCLGLPDPVFVDGDNGDHSTVTARIALNEDLELMLTADGSYPEKAPLAILHRSSKDLTTQLQLRWSATDDPTRRLLRSLMERESAADQLSLIVAFGQDGKVLTLDEKRAIELNLEPIIVGDDFLAHMAATEAGLFARSKGLLSETLRSRTVLINGAGSVGSYIAEQLVRSGIGSVILIDPDTVEFANLSRTVYTASDVGSLKVDALSRRLMSISPAVRTQALPINLHDISHDELSNLFTSVDFVVCAVDDRRAQLLINHWAYHHKKPSVFVGIYGGAKAGEVFLTEPPLSCYNCATQFRNEIPQEVTTQTDYGTGQLVAEVALGIDIQSITAASVRMVLSRLVKDQESSLAQFVEGLGSKQFMLMSVDPRNELIDSVMSETPGQYGYRTIWLGVPRKPECNVCGENPDPPVSTAHVSVGDIKEQMELAAQKEHEDSKAGEFPEFLSEGNYSSNGETYYGS